MAEEKWYQKSPVQVAMVAGVFTIVVAIIGALKGQMPSEPHTLKSAPISLPVATGASIDQSFSAESAAARQELRVGIRNISAAESGLKIDLIPPGSFGFSHPLLFQRNAHADFVVNRFPNARLDFEIHKLASKQMYAIAFVNADTQRQIRLDSKLRAPATLYSDMWPDARYAVRVDITSCRGETRIVSLDDGNHVIAADCTLVALE